MGLVTVEASPIAAGAWTPFGWMPVPDTDPRDGEHRLHFEWADPNLNVIAHEYDEVAHTDAGSVCAVMYRHDTHTQALMPLNVPAVVAVAPASVDFSEPDSLGAVRAFALQPLDCIVLFPGTWHWGPFPLGPEAVHLLNVQGARYAEDNAAVD
ncbi:MAG TPA: ureidoglycolate lyase, partial [Mycobacteriales bacterium]|nr:ureidoglycolate lyase [Mycobacteriales bacterium]